MYIYFFSSLNIFCVSNRFLFYRSSKLKSSLCPEQLWEGDIVWERCFTESIFSHIDMSATYDAKRNWIRISFLFDDLFRSPCSELRNRRSRLKSILLWSVCSVSTLEKTAMCSFLYSKASLLSLIKSASLRYFTEGYAENVYSAVLRRWSCTSENFRKEHAMGRARILQLSKLFENYL